MKKPIYGNVPVKRVSSTKTYNIGDSVYWIEPQTTIRSGVITGIIAGRYTIRRGYEAGVRLPESRLYPTYDAAAATLPPKPEIEERTGRWHYWAG